MRVTIHQPEHFPYMGFFQKMMSCDLFVILDNVNFRKNYFQNRNKFLNTLGKDEWFTVPVEKSASSKLIKDVVVSSDPNWRKKNVNKIFQNMKVDISHVYESDKLVDINMRSIAWCMKKLKIEKPIVFASNLNVSGTKSELLANIVNSVGGSVYISGPSGRDYLDLKYFSGVDIEFFNPVVSNYYSSLYNIALKGINDE